MKKIEVLLKNNWQLVALLVVSLFIVWPIFLPGYFSHHDDLQVMRIFEMKKCFLDLQIPCRWVPDMGYGNGFPLYNYYSAFPYYLGGLLSFVFGYIWAAKLLFFLPLFFGGLGIYLLSKTLYDDDHNSASSKNIALLSAILYTFAPYRSLDAYVRGAVAESFALALIPFVFYFVLNLSRKNSKINFFGLTISLGLFLLTHNIMTMFFLPILLVWTFVLIVRSKGTNFKSIIAGFILAFGIAGFFLLPAFLEKDLVQTDSLTRGDLNFRVHFVAIPQLFVERDWGFGASVFGPNDTISFQIGWPHWILVAISILFLSFRLFKKKQQDIFLTFSILFFVIVFAGGIFMTHNLSAFVWEKIGLLRFTQFPWRFLSLAIFSASIIGVYFVSKIAERYRLIIVLIIGVLTILLNVSYFRPEKFYWGMTDGMKLTGPEWEQQQKASILDYLPVGASEPKEEAPESPIIRGGDANIFSLDKGTDWFESKIEVLEGGTSIEFPIFDFPDWQLTANGKPVNKNANNHVGRIEITLDKGTYTIDGKLHNTLIRTFGNGLSLVSILILIGIYYYDKRKKIFA